MIKIYKIHLNITKMPKLKVRKAAKKRYKQIGPKKFITKESL